MSLCLKQKAFADIYHVKSDGDDKKSGTSDETAWRTIQKVNGHSFIHEIINLKQLSVRNKGVTLSKFEMFMKRHPICRKTYSLMPQRFNVFCKKYLRKYFLPEEPIMYNDQEKQIMHDLLINDMRKFHNEYGFIVKKLGCYI